MPLTRRAFAGLALGAGLLPLFPSITMAGPGPRRVLFVGNSISYYNDIPAVLAQLAAAVYGVDIEADMLARGGASLADHLAHGSLLQEIARGHFDTVILQERSGLLACPQRVQEECEASKLAHRRIADALRQHGLRGLMLGTPRKRRELAAQLHAAEALLAAECGLLHVPMSDADLLIAREPGLLWLDADDFHPGPDWTLVAAIRVLRALLPGVVESAAARSAKSAFEADAGDRAEAPALSLHYRDYRELQSPSFGRLASAVDVGARQATRKLSADEYALRERLALSPVVVD